VRAWGILGEQPAVTEVGGTSQDKTEAIRAATAICEKYGAFIRCVLRFQAGRRFEDADLFQEFFLLLVHKPVPPDVRNVKSFLYRAITNYVLDLLRKRTRYRHHLKKYAEEIRISINNRPLASAFVHDRENDAAAYLSRLLQGREAQAFALKYRDNCSVAEIAARMGVDRRTVSRYLAESRKKLRRGLAGEQGTS
jgi:RNA polymerase sigma factor (sigma-70 family)